MKKVVGFVVVSLILLGMGFPSFVNAKEDPFEEWEKEHTVRVLVTEELSYKNGQLSRQVIYSGRELKAKVKVNSILKSERIPMDKRSLEILFPKEAQTLARGVKTRRIYYKTTVLTRSDDPYQWWKNDPYLPRWTWEYIGRGIFEKADPVNLIWENTKKYGVKRVLRNAGWWDYVLATPHYIYDPPEYGGSGWEIGDNIATSFTGIPNRYHMRLWVIYTEQIVGSTHYEYWSWIRFTHVIVSYEAAEDKVASYYTYPWDVMPDFYYLGNHILKPLNDGGATKITKITKISG